MKTFTMTTLVVALSLLTASAAVAGDRVLEVLVVNMTPDAEVTDASRRCFQHILRKIRDEYTHTTRMGESALLREIGRSDPREFMDWPSDALEPLRRRQDPPWLDAVALVDCRPEARRVDVLVVSPARGMARMRLRGVELDRARAQWIAERILEHGWVGFTP